MTPDPGLSFGLYVPLILAGVLYAALLVGASVLEGRGSASSESARNVAFICILAGAAYAVVLLVITAVSKAGVLEDFVYITLIAIAFFALLAVVLLLVEMLVSALGRLRRRRS